MSRPKAHRRKHTTIITTITITITITTNIIITTTTTARPKKCNLGDASDGGVFGRGVRRRRGRKAGQSQPVERFGARTGR